MPARMNPSKAFENILAASKASGGWTLDEDGTTVVVVLSGPYTGSWRFQTRPNRTFWTDTFEAVPSTYGGLRAYQLEKVAAALRPLRQAVMNTRVPLFWAPHVMVQISSDLIQTNPLAVQKARRDNKIPVSPKKAAARKRIIAKLPRKFPPIQVIRNSLSGNVHIWEDLYIFMNMAGISAKELAKMLAQQPKRWTAFRGDDVVIDAQKQVLRAILLAADVLKAQYENQNFFEHTSDRKDIGYIQKATNFIHNYFPDLPVQETVAYLRTSYLETANSAPRDSIDLASVLAGRVEGRKNVFHRMVDDLNERPYSTPLRYPRGLKDRLCFAKNFAKTWSTKKALRMTCPNIEAAHKIKRFQPQDIPMMKWALNYIPSVRQKIPEHAGSEEIAGMAQLMKSRAMKAADFRKLLTSKNGWQKLQNLHGALLPLHSDVDGDALAEYLAESVKGRRIIAAMDRKDWARLVKEAPTIMRVYRGQESLHEDGLTFRQFARVKEQTEVSEARIEALQDFRYPPGVYPLIHEEDYAAEGDKMDHCIYSYRVSRKSLFFGFDCGSTNATLEVSLAGEVHQFYAEHNGPPSEECKQLLQQFLAMNEDRFAAFRKAGRTRVNPRKQPSRRRKARQPRRRR